MKLKRVLGKALLVGMWFTIITTAIQLGWTAFVHLHPDWASWRTPGVWLAAAVAVLYCIGKVGICYFSRKKVLRSAEASS